MEQVVGHLLGDLAGDVFLRLGRCRAQMRGADHLRQTEERVLDRGFGFEGVDRGTGHMARPDRLGERRLVDQPAARAVDDAHPRPGPGQRPGIEDPPRLVGQRHMQGDDVGAAQKRVQIDLLDPQPGCPLL
jgi:hypothetical protein